MQRQLGSGAISMNQLNAARNNLRNAINDTGNYAVQAVRAQSATQMLTEAIIKQDLGFKKSMQVRKQFNNILREQYQLQRMTVAQWTQSSTGAAMSADAIIPRQASANVDRMTQSLRANAAGFRAGLTSMTAWNEAWSVMRVRIGLTSAALTASSEAMIKWGKNTQWAGRQLMVGFTVPLIAFGAVAGKTAYEVDKQLTRIQKVYDTTAKTAAGRTQELDRVRVESMAMATQVASKYGQSLKDTLSLEADLAATGLKGQQLQQATVEVTRAATLGELDKQQAMKATIAMQSVYGYNSDQLAKAFNYMNAMENATSLSMQDFIDAIPRGAGVMKNMGVSLKEMGIILVALKQSGVSAAEGMNGMRSAAQRLLMITPKAEETWKNLLPDEGTLSSIVQANKGKFIPTLQAIGTAMKGLEPYQKQQIIARVFGVYQANKIYAVLDGLINKTNQVSTAYQIMAQSSDKNAKIAEGELTKLAESASGKFNRALESIKAKLASVGEPFLMVGAKILGMIGKVFDLFNAMPSVVKTALATFVIGGAILGPVIMLIGLFSNLIGQLLKLSGAFVGLFTRFRPLTVEQRAQQMLAEKSTVAWTNQAHAAQALSGQLSILTASLERAVVAQMQLAGAAPSSIGVAVPSTLNANRYTQTANGRYRDTTTGRFVSNQEGQAYAAAQAAAARSAQQTAVATTATARNWSKIGAYAGGIGIVAATMATASGSSSEMLNNITNAVFAASLLGPILIKAFQNSALASAFTSMTSAFGTGARAGSIAGRGGIGRIASGLSAAAAPAGRLVMLFTRFAGPAGLLVTAGYLAFKLYGNMKRGIEVQKKINESAKDWSDILGFVYTEAGDIQDQDGKTVSTLDTQVTKLKEKNKELVKSLQLAKQNGNEEDAINLAIAEGLKLRAHGASAEQAYQGAEISLRAAGYTSEVIQTLMIKVKAQVDFSDAKSTLNKQMDQFKDDFNKIANNKFGQGNWEGLVRAFSGRGEVNQNAAERGKGMANEFWTGFQKETDLQSRRKYFDKFFASVEAEQHVAWGRLGNDNRKDLEKVGITSWEAFAQAYTDSQKMTQVDFTNIYGEGDPKKAAAVKQALNGLGKDTTLYAQKHIDAEKLIAQAIAKKNNMSDEDIAKVKTLKDLYGSLDMATMTTADAQNAFANAMLYSAHITANMSKTEAAAYNLKILNQYRVAAGLGKTTKLEYGFGNAVDGSTSSLTANAAALAAATSSADDFNNARQKSMSGAQDFAMQQADEIWSKNAEAQVQAIEDRGQKREDALDAVAEAQDARFDARAEAADKRFDKRSKALDSRWETIMDKFDSNWDKRLQKEEDAYNQKIDNIKAEIQAEEDAEDARQKIFEAEKTRLERLADIANQRIDFNVAVNTGNLDEAAKVMNTIQSTQDSWTLDDASQSSQSASDARKAKLETDITKIEKQRDARLAALKVVEDAEKKALEAKKTREEEALAEEKERYDKALQAERDRYKKGVEAQKKALQAETKRDSDAKQAELDRKKKLLDLEISAVKASVPRNKKEYDAQIKTIEGLYKKYGVNLKSQGNHWSELIGKGLTANIRAASSDLANDIKWKNIANQITSEMVNGGFGMTTAQFMKWVTTGQLPKNYKAPKALTRAEQNKNYSGNSVTGARHTGGPVGGASKYDNRGGRNWGTGIRRDEKMMLLKNNEYVLNEKAHKNLGTDYLDNLNSSGGKYGIGGAGIGMVSPFTAGLVGLYRAAAQAAVNSAGANALMSGIDGTAIAGSAGKYGNINLTSEQLKNAATIIGVGKGMGATSRDLIVSIMTAMQESTLRNVHYGDRDSLGLFQQRPSQGWGTEDQILNPSYSSRKFFEHLLAMKGRNKLSLAGEAQAVQRSGNGSLYAKWEAMARAVVSGTGFTAFSGVGGKRRPVTGSVSRDWKHHNNLPRATDFGVGVGTPVYSAMSGTVTASRDLKGAGNGGYRSYGRYMVVENGVDKTLYAHLSKRNLGVGSSVAAGSLLGYSGNTGNSTGPHLHFETWRNGVDIPPGKFGIPGLKSGGFTLNDGIAMLHKKETVLTAPLSEQLKSGIQRIDQGVNNDYNVNIDLRGAYIRDDVDIMKAVNKAIDSKESKLGRKRSIQ
jgi:TP901 family phage tail tape measure protein